MRYDVGRFRRPMRRSTEGQLMSLISLGDGSTLSLDFTTGVLDSRLTFTRASNATFINSSGLVQWAASNHAPRTNWNFTSPTGSGWNAATTSGTGTFQWVGDGTVIASSGSSGQAFTSITTSTGIAEGLRYVMSVTAQSVTGSPTIQSIFDMTNASGNNYFKNGATATAGTTVASGDRISVSAVATATTMNVRMGCGAWFANRTNESVTLTQFHWHPGSSPVSYYENTATSPRYDSARFDYDPTTLAPKGLLIEATVSNLCLNGSMAYTATAPTSWVRGFSGCTVASVDSTTFLGQKAWSIAATASGQRDLLEQVISLAANTTYTVSVYLEAVTGTTATFAYMTSLPAGATSGSVVNPSSGRVSFTVTVGATAGSGTVRIGIGSAIGTGVSADASVRFSHVQVEAGSGASSYIPTGASTVTKNEDSATMSSVASLGFDQYQGTFIVRGVQNKQGAFFARLLRIAGTTTEPFGMPVNGVTLYGTSRNALNASIGEATRANTLGQAFAFGMSLDANDAAAAMRVSLNGSSTSASRTNLGPTEAAASFSFNTNATATNYGCFAVRSVKFFPVTKTLAELNALTT